MLDSLKQARPYVYFLATRPAFLTASAAPVVVGSAMGFAAAGTFSVCLFLLGLFATMLLHSGANVANDYYDHLSGNDEANKRPTLFSGGCRFIQEGIMSAKGTLLEAVILLAGGAALGIVIVALTRSLFILMLGLAGLLGGFFYTAEPIKLCYRTLGEITIGILFGVLPVCGSYYLQAGQFDFRVIPAAVITALLIFLIILINEFRDVGPDGYVGKKTLVVRFGVPVCVIVYRAALILTYLIAAASIFLDSVMLYAAVGYLLTLPLGINVFRLANTTGLTGSKDLRVNARTIALHAAGALALTIGSVIYGLAATRP